MAIYGVLRDELTNDPLGRGYAGMTDAQVLDSLLTVNRTVNIPSVSGQQLFSATNGPEFSALNDAKKQMWVSFCTNVSVDPFGTANVAFVQWIFGSGSTTVSNLAALRTKQVSRAEELGIPSVQIHHIQHVRA